METFFTVVPAITQYPCPARLSATPGRHRAGWLVLLLILLGRALPSHGQAISWTGVSSATVTNLSGVTPAASNTYYNIRNAVLDDSGNLVVVGEFSGVVTFGSTSLSSSGATSGACFIAKWNPTSSTWMWAYSGGTSATAAFYNHVAVSGTSVYVAGSFATSTVIGSTTLTSPGYNGLFLAKFTDNGSSLTNVWAKKLTTSVQQSPTGVNSSLSTCGVTVWGSNVYMAGRFVNDITVEGTAQLSSPNNGNIFLAKFADTGTASWAVQAGGTFNDSPADVKAGPNGIYVTGSFGASTTYGTNNFTNFGSSNDICLIKFTDTGSVGWAKQEGGASGDSGNRLFVDGSNVYMGGTFAGATANIGGTAITTGSGNPNMFVAKYLDNGATVTPKWGTNSTANGSGNGLSVDGLGVSGNMVYAAGSFNPTATVAGDNLTTVSGGADVYVARFTDNGSTVTNNGAISGGKAGATGANDSSERLIISGSTLYLCTRTYAGAVFGSSTLPNNGPYILGCIAKVNLPGAAPAAPTVTLTSGTVANGGTTSTSPVAFTATFSASVTGFAASDLTVSGGSVTTGSFSGSGTTYTFTVTPSGAGSVSVTVPASAAQNGTANNTASSAYTFTYSLPVTAAPVTTTPADAATITNTTPTYTGTAVSGSTVTVYVDGTALSGTVTATGGSWSKVQPAALGQGSHNVKATAQATGATVSGFSNLNTFTVDNVAPTVAITSPAGASGSTTSTSPIPFNITFSEPVANFVIGDITVSAGTKSGLTTVSSSQYTFTLTPGGPGTFTVNVAANVANDPAGNNNTAAPQFTITYQPVTATPVVSTPANSSLTNNPTPSYTGTAAAGSAVTVYVDGLALSGTVTATGGNWTFPQPTGLTDGVHTVRATAQSSGYAVSASSGTNTFTVDASPPATPVVNTPTNGALLTTTTPTYSGTAEAGSTVTVYVDGTALSGTVTATGGNWSKVQSPALAQGTHSVYVRATDAAGNTSGNSNTRNFTVDTVVPTVTITSSAGASGSTTTTSPIPFTITFSEAVSGFVIGDITVSGGTKSALTTVSSSQYTFTLTPGGPATFTVNVAASVANDPAGNNNTAAPTFTITYALPAPTITGLSPAAELPGMPVVITGTGFTAASTVTFGGVAASSLTYTSANSLTATVPAGAAVGSSTVVVTTAGTPSTSAPAFSVLKVYDAVAACLSTTNYTATGDGAWHYLLATNGQVVAALQDTRAALGTVSAQFLITGTASPVRQDGNEHRYLDRNWHLVATNPTFTGSSLNVRFYGLTSEFARLVAADATVSYATLKATQYSGANEDCQLGNNAAAGQHRTLSLTASTPGNGVVWFVAQANVPDHFSEFYLTGSSAPLPVELVTFTAAAKGSAVQLNWRTASEKNSARFEVERSLDGKAFTRIGEIAAQGTKTSPTDYAHLDSQAPKTPIPQAPIYYRLRQVDHDGAASYSPVRAVTIGDRPVLTLYPNPAHTTVTVTGLIAGAVVEVFDALGRRLAHATADAAGTTPLALPAELPAGMYVLRSGDQARRLVIE